MSKVIHVCQSVEGALMNWRASAWRRALRDSATGRYLEPREVKAWFIEELAQGHRVVPIGPPCEGFDYTKGCPGHEKTEAAP